MAQALEALGARYFARGTEEGISWKRRVIWKCDFAWRDPPCSSDRDRLRIFARFCLRPVCACVLACACSRVGIAVRGCCLRGFVTTGPFLRVCTGLSVCLGMPRRRVCFSFLGAQCVRACDLCGPCLPSTVCASSSSSGDATTSSLPRASSLFALGPQEGAPKHGRPLLLPPLRDVG